MLFEYVSADDRDLAVVCTDSPQLAEMPWVIFVVRHGVEIVNYEGQIPVDQSATLRLSALTSRPGVVLDIVIVNVNASDPHAVRLDRVKGRPARSVRIHRDISVAAGQEWSYREAVGRV